MKHKIVIASLVLILFLALGFGYAFLPYTSKVHFSITFGLQETWSMILGFLIAFLGLIFSILILLTDALKKFKKIGKKYWFFWIIFDITKWILIIGMGYFMIRGGVGITQSFVS